MRGLFDWIDGNDLLIIVGLFLIGYGLYLIWEPLTPLIIGALFFILGVVGIWRKGSIK